MKKNEPKERGNKLDFLNEKEGENKNEKEGINHKCKMTKEKSKVHM